MDASNFLDFTELPKQYTHRKKDADKKPVLISKAVWMNFGQGEDTSGELKKHPNEYGLGIRTTQTSQEAKWAFLRVGKGHLHLV